MKWLLTLAFCAIAATGTAQTARIEPSGTSFGPRAADIPPVVSSVLYDQTDSAGSTSVNSQDFETAEDSIDDQLADDFIVPAGESWSITEVDAAGVYYAGTGPSQSFNVYFYADAGGLPGALVASQAGLGYTNGASPMIPLSPPVVLPQGAYWVSVQSRMDTTVGYWGWTDRTVQWGANAVWQNPANGWGTGCTTWGAMLSCAGGDGPDLVFRLIGTATFAIPGTFPPDETFDEQVAPNVSEDWSTAASGSGMSWSTSTDAADTPYNAAFAPDIADVSDMTLDTPVFVPAVAATLAFRHQFNLEDNYDGAVLEISIDGGAFQDFVAAGGSFTVGGYNGTISTCCSNPLAGRAAWTGDSGGFVDVAGSFPTAAIGQPTVLRFRTGDDSSETATPPNGWWVDTIHVDADGGGVPGTLPPDETFDEQTAPSVPSDWPTAAGGNGVPWVTDSTMADTAPNSAHAPDFPSVSDMTVETPAFTPVAPATLSFRHQFNLEDNYDGAVLEISIGGGAFQDFVAAGGSFTTGGYNGTISTCCSSPLAGRAAWTGNSGGFVAMTGTFPAAAIGQPTKLRFRTADDDSVSPTPPNGWWVDTIHVDAYMPIADITPTPLDFSVSAGGSTSAPLTIANAGTGTLDWSIAEANAPQSGSPGHHAWDTPSAWANASPVPADLARYGFAQDGDDLYLVGGVSDGSLVNTSYRYRTAINTWSTLTPLPAGVTGEAPTAAYFDGKLYVVGGSGVSAPNIYIYDIATNTWSSGAAFPDAGGTYGAAGGAFNGKFFVAGGTGATASTTLWVYDIASNTWSPGTALPSGYYLGGYRQVGQYLYLVGSYGISPSPPVRPASALNGVPQRNTTAPNANGAATLRLDMSSATGIWATGPAWTMARADFGLAYDPGTNSLYAIGGDASGGTFFDPQTEVDQLDLDAWPAGTWVVSGPPLPAPLQANQSGFHTTGMAGGEIWSTGGVDSSLFFYNIHQYRTNGAGCSAPSDVPWLSESPTSGAVNAGESQDSIVTVDASALAVGSYTANLCVTINDQTLGLAVVPVNVTVVTQTYVVTPSVGTPSGTITPDTPQTVTGGATTQFMLTPDAGYHIDNVGGTCGGTLAGNVFTTNPVTADCTVIANFAADATFTVGGTVSGLTGSGLVLNLNGTENLPIAADGSFTFTTQLADGASYDVTVGTQPAGQSCSVANGSGTISGANVTDVAVTCASSNDTIFMDGFDGP